MKLTFNALLGAACLAIGLVGSQTTASASAIHGELDFVGVATTDTGNLATAHSFTSFTNVFALGNETGTYAPIPDLTPVTMNPFTFNPTGGGVSPLWTVSYAGITYTFDLTEVTAFTYNPATLSLSIAGIGTAFDTNGDTPTHGLYTFTSTGRSGAPSTKFTFNSATTVPDSGTTVALLGLSLVAVEGTRRALNAKRAVKA